MLQQKININKLARTKLGLTNRNTIIEEILNNHAKQGWVLHTATEGFVQLIFERKK